MNAAFHLLRIFISSEVLNFGRFCCPTEIAIVSAAISRLLNEIMVPY